MKTPKKISAGEKKLVRLWVDKAQNAATLKRVLCVWYRIKGHKAEEIHEMLGWSVGQIQKIQSEFLRTGECVFMKPGKGGRRNQYLSSVGETAFINSLRDKKTGIIFLKISEIKIRFASAAKIKEDSVAASTIYRLLERHGYKSVQLNDGRRVFNN